MPSLHAARVMRARSSFKNRKSPKNLQLELIIQFRGMRGIRAIVLSFATVYAIGSSQRQSLPDGVLHFPLLREEPSAEALQRRGEAALHLSKGTSSYAVELSIGSEEQKVMVLVDSDSNELWVMDSENPRCYSVVNGSNTLYPSHPNNLFGIECNAAFMFSGNKSTPSDDGLFYIQPDRFHFAEGYYAQDIIEIGGVSVENATFGIATETSIAKSMFGIGLGPVNASMSRGNLLAQMSEKGLIKANAYSLWLDSANKGSLLLGGVDHSRYTGVLQTVPLISDKPNSKEPTDFKILLNGIAAYQGGRSAAIVECSLPALLVVGDNSMILPDALFAAVVESIGALKIEQGSFVIPCELDGGLTFDFSGIKIDIPFTKLAKPDSGFKDLCKIDIIGGGRTVSLSSSFLSSVYAVFDIDNNEIALAKQASNVSDAPSSSVEAISSSIPGASQAVSYSSTQIMNSVRTSYVSIIENSMTTAYPELISSQLSQSGGSDLIWVSPSPTEGTDNAISAPTPTDTTAVTLKSTSSPSRSANGSSSKPTARATDSQSKENKKNGAHAIHKRTSTLGFVLGTLGLTLVL